MREDILSVATRRFARQGFTGTSLQEIADEVGIKKPSLLHHFESKDALRDGVLAGLLAHFRDALPRLLGAVSKGSDRFEVLTRELVSFFRADPDRARLLARELMDRPDEMRAMLARDVGTWVALLADYIRAGQTSGRIHADVDPEAYVIHVITLVITALAVAPIVTDLYGAGRAADRTDRHVRELLRLAKAGLFLPRPGATKGRAR